MTRQRSRKRSSSSNGPKGQISGRPSEQPEERERMVGWRGGEVGKEEEPGRGGNRWSAAQKPLPVPTRSLRVSCHDNRKQDSRTHPFWRWEEEAPPPMAHTWAGDSDPHPGFGDLTNSAAMKVPARVLRNIGGTLRFPPPGPGPRGLLLEPGLGAGWW